MRNMQMELRTALANIKQVQKLTSYHINVRGIMLDLFGEKNQFSCFTTEHPHPRAGFESLCFVFQLEEEKEDINRQLSHEKSARLLQEQINEEQVQVQAALHGKEDVSLLGSQVLQLLCMKAIVNIS